MLTEEKEGTDLLNLKDEFVKRKKTVYLIRVLGIGVFIFLLLTIILAVYLTKSRHMVRPFLVNKALRTFKTDLDYDRLTLEFFPVPHLEVHGLHLGQPERFALSARKLSLYPDLWPILSGRFRIRRLVLIDSDIRCFLPESHSVSESVSGKETSFDPSDGISFVFTFLASIDPETRFRVRNSQLSFFFENTLVEKVHLSHADFTHTGEKLWLDINGTSAFTGSFYVEAGANATITRINGELGVTAMNPETLISFFPLPEHIKIQGEPASFQLNFTLVNPDRVFTQFNLTLPALTLAVADPSLSLDQIQASGFIGYMEKKWVLSVDRFSVEEPEIALSGQALLRSAADTDNRIVDLRLGADTLDIAVAGNIARAVSGNAPGIDTAFSVARSGVLTELSCTARFSNTTDSAASGWTLDTLSAAAHLDQGRVTLPGIHTDLTDLAGEVAYADTQAAFRQMRGIFQGIRFSDLSADIDWTGDAVLSLETASAEVDAGVFYPWLTGFEGPASARSVINTLSGKASLSWVHINGPLTDPAKWRLDVGGVPQDIQLITPHAPFPITLQGGEIIYHPGREETRKVGVRFLDAVVTVSHKSRGIVPPQAVSCQIDGILGQSAVEWLANLLSVPTALVIRAPVTLSGIDLQWDGKQAVAVAGNLKTANAVEVYGDISRLQDTWQVRKINFSDPDSTAAISASRKDAVVSVTFSGNIDAKTAGRLFSRNEVLSGSLAGRFTAHIHLDQPLFPDFSGTLSGKGIHPVWLRPVSVDINQFSLSGSGGRVSLSDSEIRINDVLVKAEGEVFRQNRVPRFDLRLFTESLNMEWLQRLVEPENTKEKDKTPEFLSSSSGTVHLKINRFQAGNFVIIPLEAVMAVERCDIHSQIKAATVCGITATGAVNFTSSGLSLNLDFSAEDGKLDESLACFPDVPLKADGRYQLSGHLSMPPVKADYLGAMTGNVILTSENGRILHDHVLMNILSVLNITELVTGSASDLNQPGFGYRLSQVRATLSGGQLQVNEILLDSSALKITGEGKIDLVAHTADMYLLAAPMRTVDRIVRHVPGLNYLFGGSLVSIPLRVHGPFTNLSVVPLSPSAVGKSLQNAMRRVLNAPFRLIEYIRDSGPWDAAPEQGTGKATAP
ncbi:AsmA-like C-terminal domain-containing protein [Desulfosarcina sp. OttesenSCG-928-A07]|nr:AsmA-like C-terminal domain-containing protein [Desulfosarcina sp. OttesenSCG-928-A07]